MARAGSACRRRSGSRLAAAILVALIAPAQALAVDGALYRSLAIPGSGQAHQGHFPKAAVFAGAAIISAVGLTVASIQYNQSIDRFRQEKREFLALQDQLNAGQIVSINELNGRFDAMNDAFAQADSRIKWRKAFLVSLVSVYTLNVVDVLRSKQHDPNVALRYSVDVDPERVLVTRSFRF